MERSGPKIGWVEAKWDQIVTEYGAVGAERQQEAAEQEQSTDWAELGTHSPLKPNNQLIS